MLPPAVPTFPTPSGEEICSHRALVTVLSAKGVPRRERNGGENVLSVRPAEDQAALGSVAHADRPSDSERAPGITINHDREPPGAGVDGLLRQNSKVE